MDDIQWALDRTTDWKKFDYDQLRRGTGFTNQAIAAMASRIDILTEIAVTLAAVVKETDAVIDDRIEEALDEFLAERIAVRKGLR